MAARETVSWEELTWSNHIEQEALIRLLIKKGVLTMEELLEEVKEVRNDYHAKKL